MPGRTGRAALLVASFFLLSGASHPATRTEKSGNIPACDLQLEPCEMIEGDLRIVLDIRPRPIRAMTGLTFMITVARRNKSVDDARVTLDLSMPGMFMGTNRPKISSQGGGVYIGTGTVPRCMSGSTLWRASLTVSEGAKNTAKEFLFHVQ